EINGFNNNFGEQVATLPAALISEQKVLGDTSDAFPDPTTATGPLDNDNSPQFAVDPTNPTHPAQMKMVVVASNPSPTSATVFGGRRALDLAYSIDGGDT